MAASRFPSCAGTIKNAGERYCARRAQKTTTRAAVPPAWGGQGRRARPGRGAAQHHRDELMAGQAMMAEMHPRELAVAQHDAHAAKQAIAELGVPPAVLRFYR